MRFHTNCDCGLCRQYWDSAAGDDETVAVTVEQAPGPPWKEKCQCGERQELRDEVSTLKCQLDAANMLIRGYRENNKSGGMTMCKGEICVCNGMMPMPSEPAPQCKCEQLQRDKDELLDALVMICSGGEMVKLDMVLEGLAIMGRQEMTVEDLAMHLMCVKAVGIAQKFAIEREKENAA